MANYTANFFDEMEEPNLRSARVVVPHIFRLMPVSSVVDIGCGRGLWLKAFIEKGVTNAEGFDGEYVDREKLAFSEDSFHSVDLELPLKLSRQFDLAVCLEVAEHLPDSSADVLVENLTNAAPVILFSAAIPLQGGSHHVNEQWPSYWEEKFKVKGYVVVDALRRHIFDDERVSFFYGQNILMYVKESELARFPELLKERGEGHDKALPLIHPFLFKYYSERWRLMVPILSIFPPSLLHAGKWVLSTLHMSIAQALRYLISGALAVLTNVVALYLLVEHAGFHYLLGSIFAFAVALVVSFTMHKFFTFREPTVRHIPNQAVRYIITLAISLAINTGLMWFFVDGWSVPYLVAQVLSSGAVAVANFFAYKLFVFRLHSK